MRTMLILLLASFYFIRCSEKKESIAFTVLPAAGFNAKSFELPEGIPDSLKQAHDSCMGFSFDVNALFIQTRDTFSIGSIINRRSLKQVNSFAGLGISQSQIASLSTIITNPCYEKRALQIPLKSLLGSGFSLLLPNAPSALNQELNDAIAAANNTNMTTGSWLYLDIRSALMTILDTATSQSGLLYKQNLLDTANMILTATESVTDVSFIITTSQDISKPLLTLLQTKPSVTTTEAQTSLTLYYISDNKFQLTINGFFPVAGQFTKAEWK